MKFMGSSQGEQWHAGHKPADDIEPNQVFLNRILSFWDKLPDLDQSVEGKETTVLLVGHGAWLGYLLQHLRTDRQYEVLPNAHYEAPETHSNTGSTGKGIGRARPWYIENASLQIVRLRKEGEDDVKLKGIIEKWGDIEHLKGLDVVDDNADLI